MGIGRQLEKTMNLWRGLLFQCGANGTSNKEGPNDREGGLGEGKMNSILVKKKNILKLYILILIKNK